MLDLDPEKRCKNLDYVEQRLALAQEVGALCCVDISGSYDPSIWYAPNPSARSSWMRSLKIAND